MLTMFATTMSSVPSKTSYIGPGSDDASKGGGDMVGYFRAVIRSPKWPWWPPHALYGILKKLALRRFCMVMVSL
jgi:hypothetical protein